MITEILCRVANASTPIVFVTNNMVDGKIQAWTKGNETEMVSVDFYKTTGALSAADEEVLRVRYAKQFGLNMQEVKVRHRLPRTTRQLENLFAKPPKQPKEPLLSVETPPVVPAPVQAAPAPVASPATITMDRRASDKPVETVPEASTEPAKTPEQLIADALANLPALVAQAVAQAIPVPPSRSVRRAAAKTTKSKGTASKGAARKPAAKPIAENH